MFAYDCIFKTGMVLPPREKSFIEYNTLNCSYEYEVSEKVFNRLNGLRASSELMRYLIEKVDQTNRMIWFKNRSTYKSGTTTDRGKHIEGDRYAKISVEEAGYETNLRYLRDSVLKPRTLVPYVPGGGKIHFIGTPKPFSDPEYRAMFKRGQDRSDKEYYSREGSTYENTFLDVEQIQKTEDGYSDNPDMCAQVIYGKFIGDEVGIPFEAARVKNLWAARLSLPYRVPGSGKRIVSWDLGRKRDFTVGYTLDYTYMPFIVICDRVAMRRKPWPDIYKMMTDQHYRWGAQGMLVDSTGIGDVVLGRMQELYMPVEGVVFKEANKQSMIERLQQEMDRQIRVPANLQHIFGEQTTSSIKSPLIPELEKQLLDYRWEDKALSTDDVFALAIGIGWLHSRGVASSMRGDFLAGLSH